MYKTCAFRAGEKRKKKKMNANSKSGAVIPSLESDTHMVEGFTSTEINTRTAKFLGKDSLISLTEFLSDKESFDGIIMLLKRERDAVEYAKKQKLLDEAKQKLQRCLAKPITTLIVVTDDASKKQVDDLQKKASSVKDADGNEVEGVVSPELACRKLYWASSWRFWLVSSIAPCQRLLSKFGEGTEKRKLLVDMIQRLQQHIMAVDVVLSKVHGVDPKEYRGKDLRTELIEKKFYENTEGNASFLNLVKDSDDLTNAILQELGKSAGQPSANEDKAEQPSNKGGNKPHETKSNGKPSGKSKKKLSQQPPQS